ncbi:MAG: hypothetical protein QNJ30_09150 [Kiloniellales bacterium]|nr:hypothetical protein [Kiloniellales bacterium]
MIFFNSCNRHYLAIFLFVAIGVGVFPFARAAATEKVRVTMYQLAQVILNERSRTKLDNNVSLSWSAVHQNIGAIQGAAYVYALEGKCERFKTETLNGSRVSKQHALRVLELHASRSAASDLSTTATLFGTEAAEYWCGHR